MSSGLDLGVVSFFTTILSSGYLLWYDRRNNDVSLEQFMPERRKHKLPFKQKIVILLVSSHVLVTLNYALGLWFSLFVKKGEIYEIFGTYCAVFTMLWGSSAYSLWKRLEAYNVDVNAEAQELQQLYNFEEPLTFPNESNATSNIANSSALELDDLYDFGRGD